jgi:aryl-alcohol dehydrogenase-like predicted oxidoreductase
VRSSRPNGLRKRRLERFRTEQPPYSILVRGIELDVLRTAKRHGMGILTYSPLAGGWLSGSWSADSSPTSPARQRLVARFDMSLPENQRKLEAVEQLATVADDAGVPLIELAISFVVNHPQPAARALHEHRSLGDRAAIEAAIRDLNDAFGVRAAGRRALHDRLAEKVRASLA